MDPLYVRGVERLLGVVQALLTARDVQTVRSIVSNATLGLAGVDERLLQALADSADVAVENVRLYAALEEQIRERTAALETLRETEAQLRHSQKMEAVGQLAGAIAHDFNNLLSVILMNCAAVASELPKADPLRIDLEEIHLACERASSLTRQMLAFSRQQVFEPRLLQVNEILHGLEKMFQRLLGRKVRLIFRTAADLPPVMADAAQLEQVLMNLVVNARDAMSAEGTLTIETANVCLYPRAKEAKLAASAWDRVMIAVSDTGVGMDATTLARIFEPFFTTKEVGKGTGLGLSTAYGIVKQSGGSIAVDSEPGQGTTFRIYLPPAVEGEHAARTLPQVERLTGHENILLVESDDQIRLALQSILLRHGYRVLEAHDAGEALGFLAQDPAFIHLLLTDVVTPGMSGIELAERIQTTWPQVKILCMSGFSDEAETRHGVVDLGIAFVKKPLTPATLLMKVRQVLDAGRS